ncbi:hypothetical protein GLOTRDRAFT_139906 [Gloeophyllum trabeum ATCC 11539]|uniref:Fungal-type protein kinase domain-containing protein n=1 Tax=Gloeophyllum trabeum (strain ATCC 11539 / FP-39264 / Madison 617) TaxID=670483 RepID=S7Q2P6_GLOTA|nr:uncharacterized protein GLOTRDRAFT_139906 [Gloeophyllum trabeum ATCC 11539]EPQ53827.1 hypothetical protein GLOTRDRAFT_139906 [Gloeophyllum trabeum ATCC 11539]
MNLNRWRIRRDAFFGTVKESHSNHRILAGTEATEHLYGPVDVYEFLDDSFPEFDVSVRSTVFKEFKKRLREVKPSVKPSGGPSEKAMYASIVDALNYICENAVKNEPLPLQFHVSANERKQESKGGYRIAPDIAVLPSSSTDTYWARSLGFIEVKATENEDPFRRYRPDLKNTPTMNQAEVDSWNQLQEYAVVSFRAAPRCFLFAVGVFGNVARLFRWDRSSMLVSGPIRYKTDPTPLIEFLVGFASHARSGIDESVRMPITGPAERKLVKEKYQEAFTSRLLPKYEPLHKGYNDLVVDSTFIDIPHAEPADGVADRFVTIGPPLFCANSIFGRGTRVWLAQKLCEDREEAGFVVVKDYWRDRERWTEGNIYRAIYGASGRAFGVARLYHDYDVTADPRDRVHVASGWMVNEKLGEVVFKDLVHHRCILLSVGIPLWRFKSTRQLLHAIRDALKGHQNMCKNGVLHRDISVNNILISADPGAENEAVGFLIDPELAFADGMKDKDGELRNLTGTYQFTAVKRFQELNCEHLTWHDIESFFWVLVYVILRHTICEILHDGLKIKGYQCVPAVFTDVPGDRQLFVTDKVQSLEVENNTPLSQCIQEFALLVASHYLSPHVRERYAADELNLLTHQRVLAIFDKALNADGWPAEEDDGPVPFTILETHTVRSKRSIAENIHNAVAENSKQRKQNSTASKRTLANAFGLRERHPPRRSKRIHIEDAKEPEPAPAPESADKDDIKPSKRPGRGGLSKVKSEPKAKNIGKASSTRITRSRASCKGSKAAASPGDHRTRSGKRY